MAIVSVDTGVQEELRSILGPKYVRFLYTYLQDTETRLQDIAQILASRGGEIGKIALHAHSLGSSSAYAGALQLSELASALELEAKQGAGNAESMVSLHAAMLQCFFETKQALLVWISSTS